MFPRAQEFLMNAQQSVTMSASAGPGWHTGRLLCLKRNAMEQRSGETEFDIFLHDTQQNATHVYQLLKRKDASCAH